MNIGNKWGLVLLLLCLLTVHVLGSEQIRVGTYDNPPKVFVTPDGYTAGIFPEILNDIAREYDWKIEYVHGTWQECLDRLQSGEIDLMLDMALSEERQKLYHFSEEPVLVNWGTAFSRADLSVQSFLDMEGQTIAVMQGSIHTDGRHGIKSLTSQFGIPCQFIEVNTYNEVMMLLDAKQADIGIVNRLFGTLHANDYEVAHTPIIFNPRVLLFSANQDSKRGIRLLQTIDSSLKRAKDDPKSAYHQILAYYLGGGSREWKGQQQQYLNKLRLSPDEHRWIKEHPHIRFGIDPGFAPFEFLNRNGKFSGMSADFLNLIAQKTGLVFDRIPMDTWPECMAAIRSQQLDLLPCIGRSRERQTFLSYSTPYLTFCRVIINRLDSTDNCLSDLAERKVAVQKDSSHSQFLKEHTAIKPVLFNTFEECILAVSRGEVDATIGNLAVASHYTRNLALTNIKMAGYADPAPQSLCFGIREDWPELTTILNKALESITPQQRNAILAKWLPLPSASSSGLDLSQQEREWLLMHPRIRVVWDPSWAPIEFAAPDGSARGIAIDYLKTLEDVLGVQFETAPSTNWQTAYEGLTKRELDMCSCLAITPERLKHLIFTDSYLDLPIVLFTRDTMPYIDSIAELQELRVAVVKDYAPDEWISRRYPNLPLTRTKTLSNAFDLLSDGQVDVVVGSLLVGNYYLSKRHDHNIKIAGDTPYTYKLRMAIRKDWPIFARILQKALNALPETEQSALYRKWIWIKYEHGFNYSMLAKVIMGTLVIILLFVYWNRKLASEISRRKLIQEALAESESALRKSYADLRELEEMKENLTHMIVHDIRSPLMTISASLELLQEDIPQKNLNDDVKNGLLMAKACTREAADMAQDLLDIGRLESDRMPLAKIQTDVKKLAEAAIQTMEIQARLADINIVLSGESVFAFIDPNIIRRVLINLLGNAIKASSRNSTVTVRTFTERSQAIVEIKDEGCGIPEEYQDRLFNKFVSFEIGRPKHRTSVGLGLVFCKMAIEAHGGHISVDSTEGSGSTFTFFIPKKPEP